MMARLSTVLLLLASTIASLVAAASPPTFCKCTCFTNSTIIPLGPGHEPAATAPAAGSRDADTDSRSPFHPSILGERSASSSCSQCNRAFCLQRYNLPICKGAGEKDVVTMCFARDSRKDQIIVWAFLLGTGGLLGWAGAQRAIEYRNRKRAGITGAGAGGGAGGVGRSVGGSGLNLRGGSGGGVSAGPAAREASRPTRHGPRRARAHSSDEGHYMFARNDGAEGMSSGLGPVR